MLKKKTFAIKTLVKIKTHTNNYKIQKNNVSFHTCKSWEIFFIIPLFFFITEKSILIEIKTTVQGTNTANPEIFRHVELKEVNGSLYC